ncbi:diguanylate cyclase (GGDEF) domain-containing protein [Desulfocapsa sulfexigens DSM 10523]|uniref:Diguanylate cyclase (GGDEF) domain-containing protein n=1 Tax=Desulfocapsa sulfexigens (strain DSM 10523 / SB164P1) TaxID=1167006 RepID=M1NEJ8_DESSD|nr:GGDEF domain-containing protein [Desulfocapsa sulfexigens]AGF78129.1 diguanylate cyclase (GGDEF) domain-containing protein [Desulfocapsa sulfexigens DSM 10523]
MKFFLKYFLPIFLPWAIAFSIFFTYFYFSETDKVNTNRLEKERLNVRMGESAIYLEFQTVMSDLLILAKNKAFHHDQKLLPLESFTNLQNDVQLFSQIKGIYDQARFLNTEGVEIVRVNFKQDKATIAPASSLQNKGNRYYFQETITIDQGMVYISPLDLNIEHDRIEEPYKPMIRFGTPVFNNQGEKIGILILNYMAERLLGNFSSAVANIRDHASLVNAEGYWLKHPDPEREWGFMLDHKHNFSNVHPLEWKRIMATERGQFTSDNGLFTFATIHPLQSSQHYNSGHTEKTQATMQKDYQWKVISHVTKDDINAGNKSILLSLVQIATLVLPLLILFSWRLSQAKIKEREAVEILRHQATFDTLTGLPNRQLFHDRLSRIILDSKRLDTRFTLFFIDLDKFKIVNDSLGHTAGDQLLKEVAERIHELVRESDTVARMGGDEFTVILNTMTDRKDIIRMAQLIIDKLSQPFILNGQEASIGASIGIALFPDDGIEQTILINNADAAMYRAKEAGRNQFCFSA